MIISFIAAIPFVAFVVWLYLKFCPAGTTLKTRLGFEASVLTAIILCCITAIYYTHLTVGQGADSAWWPVIAFLFCLKLIPIILILSAIIRGIAYRKKKT